MCCSRSEAFSSIPLCLALSNRARISLSRTLSVLKMLLGHSQFDQMWLGVYKQESKVRNRTPAFFPVKITATSLQDLGDGSHLRRKLAHVLNELDPVLFEVRVGWGGVVPG